MPWSRHSRRALDVLGPCLLAALAVPAAAQSGADPGGVTTPPPRTQERSAEGPDEPPRAPERPAPGGDPPSPWYLERGTAPRQPGPLDEIPEVALELARGLRDGGVPGFFDGQFRTTAGRFDELAAVAVDPAMHHVLRVMAIMALQEAGSGEPVAAALQPLLLSPEQEFAIELQAWQERLAADDPDFVAAVRAADLSGHARFALAKDGQPEAVLAKIRVMDQFIHRNMALLLDPAVPSNFQPSIDFGRQVVFSIAYHYQQFDDYEHASEWFRKLTDNLPGMRETRWAHYNLACIAALTGRPDEALEHLRSAYAVGFTDVAWMLEDGDLASLRDLPGFQSLVDDMRNLAPAVSPPGVREGKGTPGPLQ